MQPKNLSGNQLQVHVITLLLSESLSRAWPVYQTNTSVTYIKALLTFYLASVLLIFNLWHSSNVFTRHLCKEFTDKDCLDYLNLKHELIMKNHTTPVEVVVFDLASVSMLIQTHIEIHKPCSKAYKQFREFASLLLGIEVQDVQSNNGWNEQTEEMITEQLHRVESLIYDKSHYHRNLYLAGMTFEQTHLYFMAEPEVDAEETHRRTMLENSCAKITMIAETLGAEMIPIKSALSRLVGSWEMPDRSFAWNATMLNVKNRLCRRKVEKYSEVEPNTPITTPLWAVSLVRLPEKNAQHAFLVIEGKDAKKSVIWFADFVVPKLSDLLTPGTREGKVRLKYYESPQLENCKLLYECKNELMAVSSDDRLLYSSWSISATTAKKLVENLEEYKKNPPKYNILGNASVLAWSSATSSSDEPGHNCYTFGRTALNDLKDDRIRLPKQQLEDWVFTAASRHLPDYQKKTSTEFTLTLIVAFVVVAVLAFVIGKNL